MATDSNSLRRATYGVLVASAFNAAFGVFWLIINLHDRILKTSEEKWIIALDRVTGGAIFLGSNISQSFLGITLMLFFYVLWRKQQS